jgi:hypothetical protein
MALSERSERVHWTVLLDEVLCDIDLSTVCWTWTVEIKNTDTYNVTNEAVQESLREILFHDNTQNVDLAQVRCEVIIRDNPGYLSEQHLQSNTIATTHHPLVRSRVWTHFC